MHVQSGRLIILPKKRWNVWNQDNVERCLKDEREAREAAAEVARRAVLAEAEARVAVLRQRSGASGGGGGGDAPPAAAATGLPGAPAPADDPLHFAVGVNGGSNPEHVAEAAARKVAELRRAGVAPWKLGGNGAEDDVLVSWLGWLAACVCVCVCVCVFVCVCARVRVCACV